MCSPPQVGAVAAGALGVAAHHVLHLAHLLHQLGAAEEVGHIQGGDGLEHQNAFGPCGLEHLLGLSGGGGQGLFADNVLPRRDGLEGLFGVEAVGGGQVDGIDVAAPDHLRQRVEGQGDLVVLGELGGPLLAAGADGGALHALHLSHGAEHLLGDRAGSNGSYF